LSRWASGQQENFLSDSFVHLLNVLREEDPSAFVFLVEKMTDEMISPSPDSTNDFIVTSQIDTDEGTPDIMIAGPDSYVLIEVKDQSPVDIDQIERYSRLVERNSAQSKCLILLTKYQAPVIDQQIPLRAIRWTYITELLWLVLSRIDLTDTSNYVIRQFIEFLEAKGMSVQKAGWEMVAGIAEFMNFKTVLRQAIESSGAVRVEQSSGANHQGWGIPDAVGWSVQLHIIVRFAEPGRLVFRASEEHISEGSRYEWEPSGYTKGTLERFIDLDSEEVHFFARSLDSQREVLEEFVSSCLEQTNYKAQLQS